MLWVSVRETVLDCHDDEGAEYDGPDLLVDTTVMYDCEQQNEDSISNGFTAGWITFRDGVRC